MSNLSIVLVLISIMLAVWGVSMSLDAINATIQPGWLCP